MKKSLFTFSGILLMIVSSFAQYVSRNCKTVEYNAIQRTHYPSLPSIQEFEEDFAKKIKEYQQKTKNRSLPELITIPIIFHIIHDNQPVGSATNVSQALINAQLEEVNNDFRKIAGTAGDGNGVDTEIEFCLAVVAPDGTLLSEPGINRINALSKGWDSSEYCDGDDTGYIDLVVKPQSIWNPELYYNIWVMELDCAGGYAEFPVNSGLDGLGDEHFALIDGAVIAFESVGSSTMPNPDGGDFPNGKTLVHELGHGFGLRHIWGDGNCNQDDFCDDPPRANGDTEGCPNKNTCDDTLYGNPTDPDDQVENYMDYSYDACLNMFTQDQKDRMQTIFMDNVSPRRWELKYSGACTAAPHITFSEEETTIYEGSNCGTLEFALNLNIDYAPQSNVIVNIAVNNASTLDAADYSLSATQVTFLTGDNSSQSIDIAINPDAVAENDEVLILDIATVGSGGLKGIHKQQFSLNVKNDDFTPMNTGTVISIDTLWMEDWSNQNNGNPNANWTLDQENNNSDGSKWRVNEDCPFSTIDGKTAKIMHHDSDANEYFCRYESEGNDGYTAILYRSVNATNYSNLKANFDWIGFGEFGDGTWYDFGKLVYSTNNGNSWIDIQNLRGKLSVQEADIALPANLNNSNFLIGFHWYCDDAIESPPALAVDNIFITGEKTGLTLYQGIAATENQSNGATSFDFSPNTTIHFYDKNNGHVMLSLENNSALDYGCTEVYVETAGNGAINSFYQTAQTTEKTFRVVPENNLTGGTYDVTLYYTNDEITNFLNTNADGTSSANDLTMIKSENAISDATNSNAEIITPDNITVGDFGGGFTFTTTFNSGFSAFAMSNIPPSALLPVELISFNGKLDEKRTAIILEWQTSTEINSKGFQIERTTDLSDDFEKIAWVDSQGDTETLNDYVFHDRDVEMGLTYYYRLRQVDVDGSETLSQVIVIETKKQYAVLSIFPNPTQNVLNVAIASSETTYLKIFNVYGSILFEKKICNGHNSINMEQFPKGLLLIEVHFSNGDKAVKKIIRI